MIIKQFLYRLSLCFLIVSTYACNSNGSNDELLSELRHTTDSDNIHTIDEFYDVQYFAGDSSEAKRHQLNVFVPTNIESPPLLIWIHGGAWAFGNKDSETELARQFAKNGIAVAAINYRLSPATWRDPKFDKGIKHPEHIMDVARAFSFLHTNANTYGYDKHSIFVGGYSAGAQLSALLSLDPTYLTKVGKSVRDIKGAIPIAGAYDLESYYYSHLRANGKSMADGHVKGVFGESINQLNNASPSNYLFNQWVPMLVISETQTQQYTALLEDKAKEYSYETMEFYHENSLDHNSLYTDLAGEDESSSRALILEFIAKHKRDYDLLDRGDFKLAYKVIGQGEPLFLLNGGPGFSSHNFISLADRLAKGFQIILFDQRGTGYSEMDVIDNSTITLDLMIEDLEALRKHLDLKNIRLMGHSFGGMYAMAYAARYPQRVKQIVLSHSGGMDLSFLNDTSIRPMTDYINPILNAKYLSPGYIDNPDIVSMNRSLSISPNYVFDKSKASQVFKGLAFHSEYYADINSLVWRSMRSSDYDLKLDMANFDKPVLLIHGDQDVVDPKYARESDEIFPNSKLIILKDCKHYGWIDATDTYFKVLEDFLKKGISN